MSSECLPSLDVQRGLNGHRSGVLEGLASASVCAERGAICVLSLARGIAGTLRTEAEYSVCHLHVWGLEEIRRWEVEFSSFPH